MEIASDAIRIGQVCAVEIDDESYVVWRGVDGRARTAPRYCPHLDHDLAEGYVVDTELVCAGHGWAFDGDGHSYKRNEFGRVDPKGSVPVLTVHERDGELELEIS